MKPKVKFSPTLGAIMVALLLTFNLLLAACGDTSPTSMAATTGQLVPGLGLPTETSAATPTQTNTTQANNNVPTVTPGNTNTIVTATDIVLTPAPVTTAPTTTIAPTTVTTVAAPTSTAIVAPTPTTAPTTIAVSPTLLPSVQKYSSVFANYQEGAVAVQPALKPYTVAAGLSNVINTKDFKLSDQEKALLAKNAFVIEPAQFNQFFQAYESFRYDQIPTFVTTDSILHVYHLIFDKILRTTESNYLIKDLTQLNLALYDYATTQYNQLKGTALDEAAKRELAFVAIARKLNTPADNFSIPPEIGPTVEAELKLIAAHQGFQPSPLMGSDHKEDYSQYVPRGHYTKTPELMQYFRSMVWYGRMNFRLLSDSETQSGLLLAQAITSGSSANRKASDLWSLIYEPTTFFVGNADDLTYIDYINLAKAVWGPDATTNPKVFDDAVGLATFKKATDALPPPKINSMFTRTDVPQSRDEQTKGFRVMGQRFVIDAYVFQQLVYREVGTDAKPRDLPKALDFFAALGSAQATTNLTAQNQNQFEKYDSQMAKVKGQLANLGTDTWTQNLYWAWLYNLRPFAQKYGQGYPSFMQSPAWDNKMLLTGLGSYTELKHDTILYAKQVLAERGGGPQDLPTGYVEPLPIVYARMAALLQMTKTGLQQRNLLDSSIGDTLDRMQVNATTLKNIAVKELNGQAISDNEKDFIAYWGANIESITYQAVDSDGPGRTMLNDVDASVVADIATGLNNNPLEEATGHPNLIYVVVPVNGKLVLAEGAVYSQYEFVESNGTRLTDEQWHQQLKDGKAPPLETWKQSIIAPGAPKQ